MYRLTCFKPLFDCRIALGYSCLSFVSSRAHRCWRHATLSVAASAAIGLATKQPAKPVKLQRRLPERRTTLQQREYEHCRVVGACKAQCVAGKCSPRRTLRWQLACNEGAGASCAKPPAWLAHSCKLTPSACRCQPQRAAASSAARRHAPGQQPQPPGHPHCHPSAARCACCSALAVCAPGCWPQQQSGRGCGCGFAQRPAAVAGQRAQRAWQRSWRQWAVPGLE